jgi:putative chitinase
VSHLTETDWMRVLTVMGVKPLTAGVWAAAFAEEIQPSMFSKGMDDIRGLVPQILHETTGTNPVTGRVGPLERLEENMSYTPERINAVWPSRFPTVAAAVPYAHSPAKLANFVYANRMGNGDVATGDGWLFRGMGPPMLTGRAGHARAAKLSGQDVDMIPHLLVQPRFGLEITRRWWEGEIPDELLSDQVKLRRRYNGGALGLEHVKTLAAKLDQALA